MGKGWKVFDELLQCRGFQFTLGKEFIQSGKLEMCKNGFHFCIHPSDLFIGMYPCEPKYRVCEIEYDDFNVIHGKEKSVSLKITLLRELSWDDILSLVNIGKKNVGHNNIGDHNIGCYNTGHGNLETGNTNNHNKGYRNSGASNVGSYNTGEHNQGNLNVGSYNKGNCNIGNWNIGNKNTGFLCEETPKLRIFDKDTDKPCIFFPQYFYFKLTSFIPLEEMTPKEKEENPLCEKIGGYLKVRTYHEAWRESWNNASLEDKEKTLSLPNWNNEKFKRISGIDVEQELNIGKNR